MITDEATEKQMDLKITIKYFQQTKRKPLRQNIKQNHTIELSVSIPGGEIGLNENLKLQDGLSVSLVRKQTQMNAPFILTFCEKSDGIEKKCINFLCPPATENKTNVCLNYLRIRNKISIKIKVDALNVSATRSISHNGSLTIKTVGNIYVQSKVTCPFLSMCSKNGKITMSPSSTICTQKLNCRAFRTVIEGKVLQMPTSDNNLKISHFKPTAPNKNHETDVKEISNVSLVIEGNLHIAKDCMIGFSENSYKTKKLFVDCLTIDVSEDIQNFGNVRASSTLTISCRTILSCRASKYDTAQRYVEGLEYQLGLPLHDMDNTNKIDDLNDAIINGDIRNVIRLLKQDVDPKIQLNNQYYSPIEAAEINLKQSFTPSTQKINPLVVKTSVYVKAFAKRSGNFNAANIVCNLSGHLNDLSQLLGMHISVDIKGDMVAECHSISTLGVLHGKCGGKFTIEGNAKVGEFQSFQVTELHIAKSGILVIGNGGDINVNRHFDNENMIWNCKGHLNIVTGIFSLGKTSVTSSDILTLTILQESKHWEGEIKANKASFNIKAHVVENCCINTSKSCAIKIYANEDTSKPSHFIHQGTAKVTQGCLFLESTTLPHHKDMTIEGTLTARGIMASTAYLILKETSVTTILPDINENKSQESINQSREINSNFIFKVETLQTKSNSTVVFMNETGNGTIEIHCTRLWQHCGAVEIYQGENSCNIVNITVGKFENRGTIKNLDQLNMCINESMILYTTLSALHCMTIQGHGFIKIQTGAVLQCDDGPITILRIGRVYNSCGAKINGQSVSISTINVEMNLPSFIKKCDFVNMGHITCRNNIDITAGKIANFGLIESLLAHVDLYWASESAKSTTLGGIVKSKTYIKLDVAGSSSFHFKCIGGASVNESDQIFILPNDGMTIRCAQGTALFNTKISGSSNLTVYSLKGCTVLQDISVPKLFLYYGDKSVHSAEEGNGVNCEKTFANDNLSWGHITKYQENCKHCYRSYIRLPNSCTITVQKFYSEVRDNISTLHIVTKQDSKFVCENNFSSNGMFILEGTLHMSSSSSIMAKTLETKTNSECRIISNLTTTYSKPDMTMERNEDKFTIYAENDVNLQGLIYDEHPSKLIRMVILSRQGNITISGCIKLPLITIQAWQSRFININGTIDIKGPIYCNHGNLLNIKSQSKISCSAFIIRARAAVSIAKFSMNSIVEINGPLILERTCHTEMDGCLSAKGIFAKSSRIFLKANAVCSIYPIEDGATANSNQICITCTIGDFDTEKDSKFILNTINDCLTQSDLQFQSWCHRGTLTSHNYVNSKHEININTITFINYGLFEDIHSLILSCSNEIRNFATLETRDVLYLIGCQELRNYSGATLRCFQGPVAISNVQCLQNDDDATIEGFQINLYLTNNFVNHGICSSTAEMEVRASKINNTGIVKSVSSRIRMEWSSDKCKDISIGGTVRSSELIVFVAENAKRLYCDCVSENNKLQIPKLGLHIYCQNGEIILRTRIFGKDLNSVLAINSNLGCQIEADITVGKLLMQQSNTTNDYLSNPQQQYDTNLVNGPERSNESQHFKKLTQSDIDPYRETFYLALTNNSTVVAETVKITATNTSSSFNVQINESSRLMCHNDVSVDCKLIVFGHIEASSNSTVLAESIHIVKGSICSIYACTQQQCKYTSQISKKCYIQAVGDVKLEGLLEAKDDINIQLIVHSETGDISINGGLNVFGDLAILAAFDKSISLCGNIQVSKSMYLENSKQIIIGDSSSIYCEHFVCNPSQNDNKSNSSYLDIVTIKGNLIVTGSISCVTEKFELLSKGHITISSTDENNSMIVKANDSIVLQGYLECKLNGNCVFDSEKILKVEDNCRCFLSATECIFGAKELIEMSSASTITIHKGQLFLLNELGNAEEIHGDVNLSGTITSVDEETSKTNLVTSLEIEGKNVAFSKLQISSFTKISIFSAMSCVMDAESCLRKCKSLAVDTSTLELKGSIQLCKTVKFDVMNMLVNGKVSKVEDIHINANFAVVNSGEIFANKTGISSPIYLNCPAQLNGAKCDIMPQLGDNDQRQLVIEGLLCVIIGSHIKAMSIDIKAVLHFEFASSKSTIPTVNDLDAWKRVVDSSLSQLTCNTYDKSGVEKLMQQALQMPKVICRLGVASHLCNDVVSISKNILKNGLSAFNMDELISSLNKAHSEYTNITPMTLPKNLNMRPRMRRIKEFAANKAKKLMKNIFGDDAFTTTQRFKSQDDSETKGKINITCFISEEHNSETKTGKYVSLALELNGFKGAWRNSGCCLDSCGEIMICSGLIEHKPGQQRIIQCMINARNIILTADNIEVNGSQSNTMCVNASEKATIQNANVKDSIEIKGRDTCIENSSIKYLSVLGSGNSNIESTTVSNSAIVCGHGVRIKEMTSQNLSVTSMENANISSSNVTSKLSVHSKDTVIDQTKVDQAEVTASDSANLTKIDVKNNIVINAKDIILEHTESSMLIVNATNSASITDTIASNNVTVTSKNSAKINKMTTDALIVNSTGNIHIGDVQTRELSADSTDGNIAITGFIEAKEATLIAKKGNISAHLGKSNKNFGELNMHARQIQDIEKILNNSTKGFNISDQLNLMCDDQTIIIASEINATYGISLQAASIDVRQNISSKNNVEMNATKNDMNIRKNIKIQARDTKLTAKQAINIEWGSMVKADQHVQLESLESSINLQSVSVNAKSIALKANLDINITSQDKGEQYRQSKLEAECSEGHQPAILCEAKNISIHSSRLTSHGKNVFNAENDISITEYAHEETETEESKRFWGLYKEKNVKTTTHVKGTEIDGLQNTFNAGRNFKSVAAKIKSDIGTTIQAKKQVSLLDRKTEYRTKSTTTFASGLLYHSTKEHYSENSEGTLLEDRNNTAKSAISSETSDVVWEGSSVKTGSFSESAPQGNVTHSRRVLSNYTKESQIGFFVSNTSKTDPVIGYKVGCKYSFTNSENQSTSDGSIHVGDNYVVTAKAYEANNATDIKVGGNFSIDARQVQFAGSTLESSDADFHIGMELDKTSFHLKGGGSNSNRTSNQRQNLNVGGTLILKDVDKATFNTTNTDIGTIKGKVGQMSIITRTENTNTIGAGLSVGKDFIAQTAEVDCSFQYQNSEEVRERSVMNVRSGSEGFSVNTVSLTGASMSFEGEIHDFANKIVSNEVHDKMNNINLNIDLKPPTKVGTNGNTLKMQVDYNRSRNMACITSTGGRVCEAVRKKVNTDLTKCQKVDHQISISVKLQISSTMRKQIIDLVKQLPNCVGDKQLKEFAHNISSKFHLPPNVINGLLSIARGCAGNGDVFEYLKSELNLQFHPNLVEAFEQLVRNGNVINLLVIFCDKAGIPTYSLFNIIGIVENIQTNPTFALEKCVDLLAPILGISDVTLTLIKDCINMPVSSISKHKENLITDCKTKQTNFVQNICKIFSLNDKVTNVVCTLLSDKKASEKGIIILEIFGFTEEQIKRIKIVQNEITDIAAQHKIEGKHVALLRDLLNETLTKDNILGLVVFAAKDIGIESKNIQTMINIIFAADWIERTTQLLKFLAQKFQINEQYIDGLKELIQKKEPHILVSCLAKKIDIDKRILYIVANAILKHETPQEIFKSIAKMAGIPDSAIEIMEQLIYIKFGKGQSWTKDLNLNMIRDLANSTITRENVFKVLKSSVGTMCLPQTLVSAFEKLVVNGDAREVIMLILEKIGIGKDKIDNIMYIADNVFQNPMQALIKFVDLCAPFLGMSDDIKNLVQQCVKIALSNSSSSEGHCSFKAALGACIENPNFMHIFCTVFDVNREISHIICTLMSNNTYLEKVLLLLQRIGLTPEQIESIKESQNRIKDIADTFEVTDAYIICIKSLLNNELPGGNFADILKEAVKNTGIELRIIHMIVNIFSSQNWLESIVALLTYLVSTYNINETYINGVLNLISKKDPGILVTCLAEKIGIDERIVLIVANALLKREKPQQIFKNVARLAGIPDFVIQIAETIIQKNVQIGQSWTQLLDLSVIKDVANTAITAENIFEVLKSPLFSMYLPSKLIDALEKLVVYGDARDMITFIFEKLNIRKQMIIDVIYIIDNGSKNPIQAITKLLDIIASYFGLTEEVMTLTRECISIALSDTSKYSGLGPFEVAVKTFTEHPNFLPGIGKVFSLSNDATEIIRSLLSDNTPGHKGVQLMRAFGFTPDQMECIKDIKTQSSDVAAQHQLPEACVVQMQCVLNGKIQDCNIPDLLLCATKSLGADLDIIRLTVQLFSADKRIECAEQLIQLLASNLQINGKFINVVFELLHKREPTMLVSYLAEVCGIDERIISIIANALLKRESPLQILKRIAMLAGIPDQVIQMVDKFVQNNEGKIQTWPQLLDWNIIRDLTRTAISTDNVVDILKSSLKNMCLPPNVVETFEKLIINGDANGVIMLIFEKMGIGQDKIVHIKYIVDNVFQNPMQALIRIVDLIASYYSISDNIVKLLKMCIEIALSNKATTNTLGSFKVALKTCNDNPEFLPNICKVFDFNENALHMISTLLSDKKPFEKGILILKKLGFTPQHIESCQSQLVELFHQYRVPERLVAHIQCLLNENLPDCNIDELSSLVATCIDIDVDVVRVIINIIASKDQLEGIKQLLKYFALKFNVREIYIDGIFELIQTKEPIILASCLADKIGIDKNIVSIVVDAVLKHESPQKIFESIAKMTGMPDVVTEIVDDIIKQKALTAQLWTRGFEFDIPTVQQ